MLIAASFSVSSAGANGKLDAILANMQREGSKIETFFANMEQDSIDVELGMKSNYKAAIFFKHKGKDDKARISYTKPTGQTVWINGNQIVLCQARIKQCIMTTRNKQATKNPEMSFVASPYKSIPQLKSQYDIVYLGDENGMDKLELTPKTNSSLKKVFLWVDRSLWLPVKYQFEQTNKNVSTITLSEMKINGTMADQMFKPVTDGAKVIRQ
jgi:outer membrane lipoprotein-sorting protein